MYGQHIVFRAVGRILLEQRSSRLIIWVRELECTANSVCTMMSISERVEVERRNVASTLPHPDLDPHISLGRPATNTILQ